MNTSHSLIDPAAADLVGISSQTADSLRLVPSAKSSTIGSGFIEHATVSAERFHSRQEFDRTDLTLVDTLIPAKIPAKHRDTSTKLNERQIDDRADRSRRANAKSAARDPLTGLATDKLTDTLLDTNAAESGSPLRTSLRAVGLPYPGRLLQYTPGQPLRYDAAAQQWQERMRERGWSIQVDGFYGRDSARICRQFQQAKGLPADGIVGPQTWAATFRNDVKPPAGGSGTSQINARGLELVKRFEGLSLTAYRDPVGIWTIGYGHTGPEVGPGDRITKAEAEALLKRDLARFERAVRTLVKVPLNTNQFSALVSFTYNVGTGALAESTLLRLLNQRNYQGAANQFSRWVYGGGQVLPGLVRRRDEERALFLRPV